MSFLKVSNLNKIYRTKLGFSNLVLNNLSFELQSKGMVFFLGKSGAGKSTLMHILGGLDFFDNGDIVIYNHSFRNFKIKDFDNYRNGSVGFVFQDFNLFEDMTVLENISFPMRLQGKLPDCNLIENLLKDLEIESLKDRKINELSGGQKQRVAIARALIKKPKIILADEPTGNLDSETSKQVFATLQKLSSEQLVCIVTHDIESAYTYGDRILNFQDGKLISDLTRDIDFSKKNINPFKIQKGQVVTEEILSQLHQYTKNKNSLQQHFSPTKMEYIKISPGNLKLNVSSHYPLNFAFRLGISFLKNKKFTTGLVTLAGAFSSFLVLLFCFLMPISIFNLTKQFTDKSLFSSELSNIPEVKTMMISILRTFVIVFAVCWFFLWLIIGGFVRKSIQFKRKDIGIIRALGGTSKDVFKIFFSEGFLLVCIILLWSIILGFLIKWWIAPEHSFLNFVLFCSFLPFYITFISKNLIIDEYLFLNFDKKEEILKFVDKNSNWLTQWYSIFGFIFCISLLLVFLSSFFIIKKISFKKPIDVILNK